MTVALSPTFKSSPIMPRSRHTSRAKEHNQLLFLQLVDSLYTTTEFLCTVQSSGYEYSTFLNQIITTQATAVGFTSLSTISNPLQYVVARLGTIDHPDSISTSAPSFSPPTSGSTRPQIVRSEGEPFQVLLPQQPPCMIIKYIVFLPPACPSAPFCAGSPPRCSCADA